MKVKIKRIDKSIEIPKYGTKGAACLDLSSRETITIASHTVKAIPLNVCIELPKGTWGMLAARSSLHKLGLMPANGIGVMDSDFGGDNDEWRFLAYNYTDSSITVEKGTRIAQFAVFKYEKIELEEVDHLGNTDRGGFGTTGIKTKKALANKNG